MKRLADADADALTVEEPVALPQGAATQTSHKTEAYPEILRARLASVTIYEITEDELNSLSRGTSGSIYSDLAIAFWSIAVSFLACLLTTKMDPNVFIVFVIIVAVAAAAGFILSAIWWRTRKTTRGLIETIKRRRPT
jgi:hypothetical protein